jgi:hypothetical protein
VVGFLRALSEIGKLPAELRGELEAEGVIFSAGRVGVVRHFSGHVPGVYSSSGVSRFNGGFGFSPTTDCRSKSTCTQSIPPSPAR